MFDFQEFMNKQPTLGIKVEEGTFTCKIIKIEKTLSKSNNEIIAMQFEVTDGTLVGGKFKHYWSLKKDVSKEIACRQLGKIAINDFGISPERLAEDCDTIDDALANEVAEISKKLNKKTVLFTVTRKKNGEFWDNDIKSAESTESSIADLNTTTAEDAIAALAASNS